MGWFDTVDLGASIDDAAYKKTFERHEIALGALQRNLRDASIASVILIEGWDAVGKGQVLGHLLHLLDPRWYRVVTASPPTHEEEQRPWLWRYWRHAPRNGTILLFDQGWYRPALEARATKSLGDAEFQRKCERICTLERKWANDNTPIHKFFLHISKEEQARRFEALQSEPAFSWRVGPAERRRHEAHEQYVAAMEDVLEATHTAEAPWTVLPATNARYAATKLANLVEQGFKQALQPKALPLATPPELTKSSADPFEGINPGRKLPRKEYKTLLPGLQRDLRRLQHLCYEKRRAVVMVYEGQDAAGKGGNIRRLVREMDPRGYTVIPTAAPEGDERLRHYLWRFWRDLPKDGHFAIFDRSWYGRVLVERVEGFAKPFEWRRAYEEINAFEDELAAHGVIVLKFWIEISKDEQLARFKAREKTPHKQWKMTEEDWRNRKKWKDYESAAAEMIIQTSTTQAPWHIIEGNDKPHARVKVCQLLRQRLSDELEGGTP